MEVIDEILDLSRIEAGRREMAPEVLDARALIRSSLDIVSLEARKREVSLALEAENDADVYADARALRQILLNLVANAVAFTPSGGSVTVRSEEHPSELQSLMRI